MIATILILQAAYDTVGQSWRALTVLSMHAERCFAEKGSWLHAAPAAMMAWLLATVGSASVAGPVSAPHPLRSPYH
jgi:hypothetical protein